MSSLHKNAHFVNINMKKRDLFEWYKDGCSKTCKNFLAWLFFFTLWGFAISAFFHEYSYWEIYWHEIDIFDPTGRFHIILKLPNAQPFFLSKTVLLKDLLLLLAPQIFIASDGPFFVKFVISKKATILTNSSPSIWHLLNTVKSMVKISSFFVAFFENTNFT